MRRNRESAAMSRTRKKQYVEELEAQVACLHDAVRSLKTQNLELRLECERFRAPDALPPLPPLAALSPHASLEGVNCAVPMPDDLPSLEEGIDLLAADSLPADILAQLDSAVPAAKTLVPSGSRARSDEQTRSSTAAGQKRAGSPLLLGGSAKRLSAASLAFMSAVTFVCVTVNSGTAVYPNQPHVPGARMLMSLTDAAQGVVPWGSASRAASPYVAESEQAKLWPSLVREAATARDEQLSSSVTVNMPPHKPLSDAGRVTRAPQNSSWADVLRIEEAERQLAEARLALHQLRAAGEMANALANRPAVERASALADHAKALAVPRGGSAAKVSASSVPRMSASSEYGRGPVYEPVDEEEDLDTAGQSEYEAERFVFCSRAYMFDAVRRQSSGVRRPGGSSQELNFPASMPARFRHAQAYRDAQQLPMLTGGNESSASAPALKLPVVTLLLPSATLQGVVSSESSGDGDRGSGASSAGGGGGSDLMQVQCQVMNVSRFTASVPPA